MNIPASQEDKTSIPCMKSSPVTMKENIRPCRKEVKIFFLIISTPCFFIISRNSRSPQVPAIATKRSKKKRTKIPPDALWGLTTLSIKKKTTQQKLMIISAVQRKDLSFILLRITNLYEYTNTTNRIPLVLFVYLYTIRTLVVYSQS